MSDDLISRQAAIVAFYKYPNIDWTTLDVLAKIKELPSAERSGKWIYKKTMNLCQCSECQKLFLPQMQAYNYCPNCGCDMRGKDDEEKS